MKILHNLYFRAYRLMVSVGNGDIAEFASVMLLSMFFFINIISLNALLYSFGLNIDFWANTKFKLIAIMELSISIAVLYFLLVYNGKSDNIIKVFEDESKSNKRSGNIQFVLYLIGSFLFFIFTLFLEGIGK